MEALKKAREDLAFENVWSSEGQILYKDVSNGNKMKVYFDYRLYFKALLKTINGKFVFLYLFCFEVFHR